MTLLCVWLSHLANSARRQRDAVLALRRMGAEVFYEYSYMDDDGGQRAIVLNAVPPAPKWVLNWLGEDFVYDVVALSPKYHHFHNDPRVWLGPALIHNEFSDHTDRALDHIVQLKRLQSLDLHDAQISADGLAKIQRALPACEIVR